MKRLRAWCLNLDASREVDMLVETPSTKVAGKRGYFQEFVFLRLLWGGLSIELGRNLLNFQV